jgi:hypothetical protein
MPMIINERNIIVLVMLMALENMKTCKRARIMKTAIISTMKIIGIVLLPRRNMPKPEAISITGEI